MTKQQPCATSLPPSKLCRLLIFVFFLKLTVLGFLIFEPGVPFDMSSIPGYSLFFSGDGQGISSANAATGAPPAVSASLPDIGMTTQSPGMPASTVAPGAMPGIAAPVESAERERTLPSIGRTSHSLSTVNGTSDVEQTRDALSRRGEDLNRKEQELKALEKELSNKLEKMQILENRLSIMIKDAGDTMDAKFRHLVDVLSNMKTKQAAAVLETLDPKIAVKVLAGMRGRQAGEVLTFVKPEIAAQLTEALARMQLPLD